MQSDTEKNENDITQQIISCAITVHRELGPGLLESVYEACLFKELKWIGFNVERQVPVPIYYQGEFLDKEFISDILVEVKAVEVILPVHESQLVTYLKLANKKVGLLINFNVPLLKQGIRRKVNGFSDSAKLQNS